LEIGSRVLVWGKPATVTSFPGGNGWWKVMIDGESAQRGARAGNMSAPSPALPPPEPVDAPALTATRPPPAPALPPPEPMDAAPGLP